MIFYGKPLNNRYGEHGELENWWVFIIIPGSVRKWCFACDIHAHFGQEVEGGVRNEKAAW